MYSLSMSQEQISTCNRALGEERLFVQDVMWGRPKPIFETKAVMLDRQGIIEVVAALRANPVFIGPYDGSIEWLNLCDLDDTLEMLLEEDPVEGMLYGIQL